MTRSEMIALAAPPCGECDARVQRTEMDWHLDEDGNWRSVARMVCARGHRRIVEPLPPAGQE